MGKSKREHLSAKKRLNTRGSYSPVHIMEGEILTDITQKQLRIGKPVGSGGFGEIYLVSSDIVRPVPHDAMYAVKIEPHRSGPLFVEMNFYIRVAKQEMIAKWMKERNMKTLGMPHYISFGSHSYQGEKYRFLVLKRFGQDLSKIFNKCKRKFHIKTVLTLGIQILDILEYIHSHGYIHADIKASNLLLGYDDKDGDTIYLLDYGLARRYIDNWGQHKDYNPDQRRAHDGTLEYTSRDAHVGAHSRRGDLEVLAYNMIQWLSGKLPWEDEVSSPDRVALEKNNCMNNIPLFLKKCFGDDAPVVILHLLKYIVSMKFDTKPDYDYCKTLLRQGIRQAGYMDDGKLNFNTPPVKLKTKKRFLDIDIENLVELKPIKIPRTTARQPCLPVQQNCNRITRQQTATNTLALRSRESFDWVKVLQSDPEKILKSQNTTHNIQVRRNKKKPEKKNITSEINLSKARENPRDNPTPAMFEVLKMRGATANGYTGRRNRSDSGCSSPILYDHNSLTPAMEEVIKRRESNKRSDGHGELKPIMTATSARANRLRLRNESKLIKPIPSEPLEIINIKKSSQKISSPKTKLPVKSGRRKVGKCSVSLKKGSVIRERPQTGLISNEKQIETRRISQRLNKKVKRSGKGLPTLPKYTAKRKLKYNRRKRITPREVSPSETNFVSKLRSGLDISEDYKILQFYANNLDSKSRIRHYAAKDVTPKVSFVSNIYTRPSLRRHAIAITLAKLH